MYFGKSKNTGNYTFSFIEGMLDEAVEISDEQHRVLINCSDDEMWSADENGNPIIIKRPAHIFTEEERLEERVIYHSNTDNDYAKYSRNIRLGIDVEYSQSVLNYIDQYNQQVSETVNQEGFPQEVVYPEYKLPEKPINT